MDQNSANYQLSPPIFLLRAEDRKIGRPIVHQDLPYVPGSMLPSFLDQSTRWRLGKRRLSGANGPNEHDCTFEFTSSRNMILFLPEQHCVNLICLHASLAQLLDDGSSWPNMINMYEHELIHPWCITAPVLSTWVSKT